MSHAAQVAELGKSAAAASSGWGAAMSEQVEEGSALLLYWLQYLITYETTKTANNLLPAIASAVRETAGCLSLGLVRPALFSFRCQVDLLLSWLYYKDHPVEWASVNDTSDGFKLKKELFAYFEQHHDGFKAKFKILSDLKTRKTLDPYRLLSAHIHAQSAAVLPNVAHLKELVRTKTECEECASVSFEVSEYLNDILLCIYRSRWVSLPGAIQKPAAIRFSSQPDLATFLG
jgi:hypothetical protein